MHLELISREDWSAIKQNKPTPIMTLDNYILKKIVNIKTNLVLSVVNKDISSYIASQTESNGCFEIQWQWLNFWQMNRKENMLILRLMGTC